MATRRNAICTCEAITVDGTRCSRTASNGDLCSMHTKSLERGKHVRNEYGIVAPIDGPLLGEYVNPDMLLLESTVARTNWKEARA